MKNRKVVWLVNFFFFIFRIITDYLPPNYYETIFSCINPGEIKSRYITKYENYYLRILIPSLWLLFYFLSVFFLKHFFYYGWYRKQIQLVTRNYLLRIIHQLTVTWGEIWSWEKKINNRNNFFFIQRTVIITAQIWLKLEYGKINFQPWNEIIISVESLQWCFQLI